MPGLASSGRFGRTVALTLVLFVLGLLLSVQFKTQQAILNSLESQKTVDLVAMWKNLSQKRTKLEQEIGELHRRQSTLTEESAKGQTTLKEARTELEKLQIASGLVKVAGPGITVTIKGERSLLYLDLVDLINELWVSGAEAIAVNGHRMTLNTAIADAEDRNNVFITLDGERLQYPLVIQAIGDPPTLEKGLTFVGGLVDNLNTLYAVYPQIKQEEELILPAAPNPPLWKKIRVKR